MHKIFKKYGFTLAELLIVVAIIGVLVAISIPIFSNQLRKARLATNQANARAAYAQAMIWLTYNSDIIESQSIEGGAYDCSTGVFTPGVLNSPSGYPVLSGDITSWDIDDGGLKRKIGDNIYKKWDLRWDPWDFDGSIVEYMAYN